MIMKIILVISLVFSVNLTADLVNDAYVQYKKGNYKASEKIFLEACDIGQDNACYNLAHMYSNVGAIQDKNKAIKLYSKVCENGHVQGCYNLGSMYYTGDGVKKDMDKAIALYFKACDGGYAEACRGYEILYNCPSNKKRTNFKFW
jgi:uncharacterized protein